VSAVIETAVRFQRRNITVFEQSRKLKIRVENGSMKGSRGRKMPLLLLRRKT
jgi:hypothetical protein